MIPYHQLSTYIQRCCAALSPENSSTFEEKHLFTLDVAKLDNILHTNKTGLHVLAGTMTLNAYFASVTDLPLLSAMTKKQELLQLAANGYLGMTSFLLYTDRDACGNDVIFMEDEESGKPSDHHHVFKVCNETMKLSTPLISKIVSYVPTYTVVVIKKFNSAKEKFEYQCLFLPDGNMWKLVTHDKKMEKQKENPDKEKEEVVEE